MKFQIALVFAVCIIFAQGFPQQKVSDEASQEVPKSSNTPLNVREDSSEDVDKNKNGDNDGIIIERIPIFRSPFFSDPFFNFFQGMQDMMTRMREQMRHMLGGNPAADLDLGKLDPKNMTSHTETVDGHVITVNETTYTSDKGGNTLFRVKVVDIKPLPGHDDSKNDREEITPKSPENVVPDATTGTTAERRPENSEENEIPKETQETAESLAHSYEYGHDFETREYVPLPDTNEVEVFDDSRPIDLSSDIRINQMLSDQGKAGGLVMIDPDAELIDVVDGKVAESYFPSQTRYRPRYPSERMWWN